MTRRDAAAWDLTDMFDLSRPAFREPLTLPAGRNIQASIDLCESHGEKPPQPSLINNSPLGELT
jgi:hypothetical protein